MSELTRVELTWLKNRIENWIRFGRIVEEHRIDPHRRVVAFAPGGIFAFVRWASNDYGTLVSRIDILRAAGHGRVALAWPGGAQHVDAGDNGAEVVRRPTNECKDAAWCERDDTSTGGRMDRR